MSRVKALVASIVMVGGLTLMATPSEAQTVREVARNCLLNGNDNACAALGVACGRGNRAACNVLGRITDRGLARIQQLCNSGRPRACQFLNVVTQLGGSVGGTRAIAGACSQGNRNACAALSVIRCYATESATSRACRVRL